MILVEGYTDVLALHQAGLTQRVGIMGTSLTEEQVAELERIVGAWDVSLELCLDADRAGQEAMLRAARLAESASSSCASCRCPREGPGRPGRSATAPTRSASGSGRSVPFVEFHVERILERADTASAEGRDRAIAELAPALRLDAYAGALREELLRRISEPPGALARVGLRRCSKTAEIEPGARPARRPAPPTASTIDPARPRRARRFSSCASRYRRPAARALAAIDPDIHITSDRLRRAARHLAGQTEMPLAALPEDDDELARVMADLVERAGRARDVTADQLEQQRLLLERARLERAIRRAREEGGTGVGDLARAREHVLEEIHAIDTRIEKAV